MAEDDKDPRRSRRKWIDEELETPVVSAEDKKKKAKILGDRLTLLEKQLNGVDTGYGKRTEEHELAHALADTNKQGGTFRMVYNRYEAPMDQGLTPGYETRGKRSPKERMKIAIAPKDPSDVDQMVYGRARVELMAKRKALLVSTLLGSPFICGGLIYLFSNYFK